MPATESLGGSRASSQPRRNKHAAGPNSASSPYLDSRASSTGDDLSDPANMRSSIDKVRERTRRSTDERRGSEESASGKRLSALIERGSKRLKRKEKNTNGNTLGVHSGESGDLAVSDGSLLDDDGNSSLLTDDCSDNEGYVRQHLIALVRPTHLST